MIDKQNVAKIAKFLIKFGQKEYKTLPDESRFVSYSFNELNVTFEIVGGKKTFYGVIFNLFSNEMLITSDMTLLTYDEEIGEALEITDRNFYSLVNDYLANRFNFLIRFRL